MKEFYGEKKWDSLKGLQAERDKLTPEQTALYAERDKLNKQMKEVETIKENVDRILENGNQEIHRAAAI